MEQLDLILIDLAQGVYARDNQQKVVADAFKIQGWEAEFNFDPEHHFWEIMSNLEDDFSQLRRERNNSFVEDMQEYCARMRARIRAQEMDDNECEALLCCMTLFRQRAQVMAKLRECWLDTLKNQDKVLEEMHELI